MQPIPLALSIFALLAPLTAQAAGGAFEINQDCAAAGCFAGDTAGFPVTITQSGTYVLTSDLVVNSSNDAIQISASYVDLDLNGHIIDGGGSCSGTPVSACSGAVGGIGINLQTFSLDTDIRLHNGTVRGFASGGIQGGVAGDGTVLDHLTVAENILFGASFPFSSSLSIAHVRDSLFVRNILGLRGTAGFDVTNCTFAGNQTTGLQADGPATVAISRFERNGGLGLNATSGEAVALDHNMFRHNDGNSAQWAIAGTLLDMGGNVCADHACP